MKGLQESCAKWDHYNETTEIKKRTLLTLTSRQFFFWMLFCWVLCAATGGIVRGGFFWESGSPAERRLSDENNRQDNEINMLRQKLGYKNETVMVFRGITKDNSAWLELSRVENKTRSEPFEFRNWNKPDEVVGFMFKCEAYECLQWVMRQPKWYSCLNEKTYLKVVEFNEKLNAKGLKRAVKK